MAFQPADTLKNRSFVGLIIAQFLAGFNDQAIHASAMFYAINKQILTQDQAITLMPILFYSPWAIFCTLSGYFADRHSKTYTLIVWKFSEVIIALVMLAGFLTSGAGGAWIVMATVFLMGTHAAFFAPAKYGAMPEILQPHVLSRGNGILESTTFLAAIFGTVTGGLLSGAFKGQEHWIAIVLLILSLIGSAASLMIAYLPPGNPQRLFPKNLFAPLIVNLKSLLHSRPLALAVTGIAFFIFMVSYMRAVMYMHGETRVPRWDEFHTSLVVATVALGVGLGSPLAGFLSGGKIELGLVPLGCLGMIAATLFAAFTIEWDAALVISLIVIGFFSGFYMVPLYTLLQHRAPKTTKGDLIATSNFINVVGAMAASALFFVLVLLSKASGVTPLVEQTDHVAAGRLTEVDNKVHPKRVAIQEEGASKPRVFAAKTIVRNGEEVDVVLDEFDDGYFEILGGSLEEGMSVVVSRYSLSRELPSGETTKTVHFRIRPSDVPMRPVYDMAGLPRYLFLGAGLMTIGILTLLYLRLPDFFVRSVYWLRALGRFRLKAFGMHHVPTNGPVILATNCRGLESTLQLLSVTDRYTTFLVCADELGSAARLPMVTSGNLVKAGDAAKPEQWSAVREQFLRSLHDGNPVAMPLEHVPEEDLSRLLAALRERGAPIVPVFCGPLDPTRNGVLPQAIRVVFGAPLDAHASVDDIRADIRRLAAWIREHGDTIPVEAHH